MVCYHTSPTLRCHCFGYLEARGWKCYMFPSRSNLFPIFKDKWGKCMKTPLTSGSLSIDDLVKHLRNNYYQPTTVWQQTIMTKLSATKRGEIEEWTCPRALPCCVASFSIHPTSDFSWVFHTSWTHAQLASKIPMLAALFRPPWHRGSGTCSLCSKSEIRCSKCEKVSGGRHDMATSVSRNEKRQGDLGKLCHPVNLPFSD